MSAKSSSDFVHVETPEAGADPAADAGAPTSTSAAPPQSTPLPPSVTAPARPSPVPPGQGPPPPVRGVEVPRLHLKVYDAESRACARVLQLLIGFRTPAVWTVDAEVQDPQPDDASAHDEADDDESSEGSLDDEAQDERAPSATGLLATCVRQVHAVLREGREETFLMPVRALTLVVRHMDGVAYTTSATDDDLHKEIHLSAQYIASQPVLTAQHELHGVLLHEMVHVLQWNGRDTAPGGLIEGIADYVRGRHGLAPRHWTEDPADKWDAGYEKTAYFLKYIAEARLRSKKPERLVTELNARLRKHAWPGDDAPQGVLGGRSMLDWWKEYVAAKKAGASSSEVAAEGAETQADATPLDEDGLVDEEIELIIEQGDCSRRRAVQALRQHPGDLVAAIMSVVG